MTPPPTADESFDQLEPMLDAFANAMVEIENSIGGAGGGGGNGNGGLAFPARRPSISRFRRTPKLLGYWSTVADRLYKLRHCQNIAGAPLQLALFDAPIDPGLLIAAQAAGVDLSSVLSNLGASLPNYRFTALYPQALDFVNAVRAYGASLQAALEKTDAGALALLQQTTSNNCSPMADQVLDWQVQQAQNNIDAVDQTLKLAQQKYNFNDQNPDNWPMPGSTWYGARQAAAAILKAIAAAIAATAATVGPLLPAGSPALPALAALPAPDQRRRHARRQCLSNGCRIRPFDAADILDAAARVHHHRQLAAPPG